MLKFFRIYSKQLLVGFGSLLMVIFLLPAGGNLFAPDYLATPVGNIDGTTWTMRDQRTAGLELTTLAVIQRSIAGSAHQDPNRVQPPLIQNLSRSPLPGEPLEWMLLVHEAHQHGVFASVAQSQQDLQTLVNSGVKVGRLLFQAQASEELFLQALRHWRMVNQLRGLIIGQRHPSEPRMKHFARDVRSRAAVEMIAVDANHLMAQAPEPTDEQLKELFEKYRGKNPGESEPYGFGYRLDVRVKLEYLRVPLARVRESIKTEEVEAQRYYIDHPTEFLPEPEKKDDKPVATPEGPVPAPEKKDDAPKPDPTKPLPYAQVRGRIMDQLTDKAAKTKQQDIVRWISAELTRESRALPATKHGYRDTAAFAPTPLEELAQSAQERFGVLPDVIRIADRWMSLDDLKLEKGFGTSRVEISGRPISVRAYIESTQELDPAETNRIAATLKLQKNVASRPLADDEVTGQGDQYLFRLIDVDQPREPKALDEVMDRVKRDAKRLNAYKLLLENRDTLIERARNEESPKLAEQLETTVEKVGPFEAREHVRTAFLRST